MKRKHMKPQETYLSGLVREGCCHCTNHNVPWQTYHLIEEDGVKVKRCLKCRDVIL